MTNRPSLTPLSVTGEMCAANHATCRSAERMGLPSILLSPCQSVSIAPEMASSSEIDQSPGSSMLRPDSHRSSRPSFSREARCSSYHL